MLEHRTVRALLAAVVVASCGASERHCRTDEGQPTASEAPEPQASGEPAAGGSTGEPESPAATDDREEPDSSETRTAHADATTARQATGRFAKRRRRMVRQQLKGRDITDKRVLDAMRTVPRHRFVLPRWRSRAYADSPLPIGHGQTISQPYIVAYMTQVLDVRKGHEVFEVGTGSGYQAAILAELGAEVYSVEIVCELAKRARKTLKSQGYDNVHVRCGDGYEGWPEHAPFDRIILTAAPDELPDTLVDQLARGGRLVAPVGEHVQELRVVRKKEDGSVVETDLKKVRFVPMVHGDE
ncbi:MAG: protein-L-isoaspartate(D-aspartate) O-methyltransferase [Bradymonadaceae bacterium]